jgi:dethiobiotin synthetase
MGKAFFITGTDTGIGKTFITCALIELMKSEQKIVGGMKPVAAGETIHNGISINSDVFKINSFGNADLNSYGINTYSYKQAIAPHIASRINNKPISLLKIKEHYDLLKKNTDYLFVEGAGGYYVPLGEHIMTSDLIRSLNIPIILVAGIRLGCLNHTMLTVDAILKNKQNIFGWVANIVDPNMRQQEDSINYLKEKISEPFMGIIPYIERSNPVEASQHLIWPTF